MNEDTINNKSPLKPISALFTDGESSRKAINILTELGYTNDEIQVIVTDDTAGTAHEKSEKSDAASETQEETKAGTAAAAMATIGATLGAAAAISVTLATAGGALLVLGPIAAGGAMLGAGAGGLFGSLLGSSVSAEEKTFYEQGVHEGRILIVVQPHSDDDAVQIRNGWLAIGGDFGRF